MPTNEFPFPDELTITVDISCMSAPFVVTLTENFFSSPNWGEYRCACAQYFGPALNDSWVFRWSGTFLEPASGTEFFATDCDGNPIVAEGSGSRSCSVSIYIIRERIGEILEYGNINQCNRIYWLIDFTAIEQIGTDLRSVTGGLISDTVASCPANISIDSCDPLIITGDGEVVCDNSEPCEVRTTYTNCTGATWSIEVTE